MTVPGPSYARVYIARNANMAITDEVVKRTANAKVLADVNASKLGVYDPSLKAIEAEVNSLTPLQNLSQVSFVRCVIIQSKLLT